MYYVNKTWYLPFKCPTPSQAKFKLPFPGHRWHSNASMVPGGCWNFELIGILVTLLSIKLTEHLRQESSIKQIITTTVEMLLRTRSRWVLTITLLSFSSFLTSLAVIFNVPFTWKRNLTNLTKESFCNFDNWPLICRIKEWKSYTTPPPSAPTI